MSSSQSRKIFEKSYKKVKIRFTNANDCDILDIYVLLSHEKGEFSYA